MLDFLLKNKFILLLILCFGNSFSVDAQTEPTDTLLVIQNLQKYAQKNSKAQDFESAIIKLNLANKLAATPNFRIYKLAVEVQLAQLYYRLEYYSKVVEETKNILAQLDSVKASPSKASAYTLLGLASIETGNYGPAEKYLKIADSLSTLLNDKKELAMVTFGYGQLALHELNYSKSIQFFDAAIPVFNSENLPVFEAFANLYKAQAFLKMDPQQNGANTLEKAKTALDRSREINAPIQNIPVVVEGYRTAAQIALREHNINKAEKDLRLFFKKKDSIKQNYLTVIEKGIQGEWTITSLNEIIANQKLDIEKQQRSLFFGKLTGWLSIALIIILSLFALSLNKNNSLRGKTNTLLRDKNTELLVSRDKAERASQAKAQFLSTITHELRTPMYTVTGLTHLLLEENPKPEQKEHLNSLKFSGEYLLSLINNILDLNKLEANKTLVEKVPFKLKPRLEGLINSIKKAYEDSTTAVVLEYDPTLPEYIVGDPLKLSQILINLISNAIKFTEKGTVWVRVQNVTQTEKSLMIHFEVEDTGEGISKKNQKAIFETFTQGSLQINRKFGGTGLGLSIVKNLLEILDTKINLESRLGKGSKFWFDLTFGIADQENILNPDPIPADNVLLIGKEVLIVEDNKINQLITKKIMEKKLMICTVVDNGVDAIEHAKNNNYDVILMDIHMPGISGIEATEKIRKFNAHVPIIALTAVTIEENLEDFYKAGFNEFIPKPFKPEVFFEKINWVLTNKQDKFIKK